MNPDECVTCARHASPHDGLDVPDPMSDLIDRLERANRTLLSDADAAMARDNTDGGLRLANKAEGVRLALSYAREYKPRHDDTMVADVRRALGLPESVHRIDPPGCGCTDCATGYSEPHVPGDRHDIPLRYGWVTDATC